MSAVHKESRSRSITDIEGRSRSTALSQSGVVHNDDQKYRRVGAIIAFCCDQSANHALGICQPQYIRPELVGREQPSRRRRQETDPMAEFEALSTCRRLVHLIVDSSDYGRV